MLAAPDFRNYTAAEWDAERVWILSLDKQTVPLSWIYRGLQVARSITSTLNVAVKHVKSADSSHDGGGGGGGSDSVTVMVSCTIQSDGCEPVYYFCLCKALISLSFGGAIGLMFLMLGCALPVYE